MPATETQNSDLTERYQIRQHLGSGGSGDAYLAWDSSLRREVVIKRVRTVDDDENAVHRILDEAAKMAALKHPNIVSVYDINLSEGSPCIVMEHVIGQNLDERVATSGPVSLEDFVELARQTLDALVAAHKSGLIHRDLKPSNIMLSNLPSGSFQARLLDFGLAKFINVQTPSPQTVMIDGSINGTVHFISPEQLNRDPVDERSDLYSLGCSLYFALTGQQPFEGESVAEVITSHLTHRVKPPVSFRPDLKPAMSAWLLRLIKREPRERFPNAFFALLALKEAAEIDGVLSATTSSIRVDRRSASLQIPEPKRGKGRLAIPVLLFVGILAAGAAWVAGKKQNENRAREPEIQQVAAPLSSLLPAQETTPDKIAESEISPAREPTSTPVAPPDPLPEVGNAAAPVSKPAVLPAPKIVFQVTGSNTIGAKLMPALVKKFLERMGAMTLRQESPSAEETLVSFEMPGEEGRQAVQIRAHGSSTSFKALQEEACEIGMSSRPIKPAEVEALSFLGDMLSRACEHVVGLDGLAVIVNQSNPLQALTVPQVADIFSGIITDWSQVGGAPGPIHLYARDDKSGTYDCFKSLVLGETRLKSDAKRFEDSNDLSEDVSKDPAGIGFIGLPYVRNSRALALSEPGTLPMLPTPFTVATEDYVLARRLFLYAPVVPRHPWTLSFVEFALSDEGQEVVENVGFVPQRVEIEPVAPSNAMPEAYRKFLATGGGRLSLSFRFRAGQTELDAKAVRDLDRVVRFLARPENRHKQVFLLGFSDSSGSKPSNLKLSEERAREVARQLSVRGVQPAGTLAMGSEMPVASNDSKNGQDKNRRVEIWMR